MLTQLFSSFELKGKTLKNRCVVPVMVTNYCNNDGTCTERFTAYHEAKAPSGFVMIITENFAVNLLGKDFTNIPGLWSTDKPRHRALTFRGAGQAAQHAEGRGLARAVGTEQAENFPRHHGKTDVVRRGERAESFGQSFGLNDRPSFSLIRHGGKGGEGRNLPRRRYRRLPGEEP